MHTHVYTSVCQSNAELLELSMIVDVGRPDVGQVDASVAIAALIRSSMASSTFRP